MATFLLGALFGVVFGALTVGIIFVLRFKMRWN